MQKNLYNVLLAFLLISFLLLPFPTPPQGLPALAEVWAAGMKFTIYDENGTAQYSQTVDVGSIPPENWGKLRQTYTAPISGLLEVEIFNYNINFPVYFDDWHIQLTENSRPEIVQEVHWVASPI